jgi:hypothetical protein
MESPNVLAPVTEAPVDPDSEILQKAQQIEQARKEKVTRAHTRLQQVLEEEGVVIVPRITFVGNTVGEFGYQLLLKPNPPVQPKQG